ncbi:hypothetical protein [Streptomyces sp. BE133]|uniref:hypothetical protein n=1 Tax=Streptomyces sp. BE133 TaxID=3002523 RepID=UPI002E76B2D4|nr:hypothetical protein [Streptomyces sp. BE133]MEE1810139.1 hypothetical protein [Streptomyces sp. BE133]
MTTRRNDNDGWTIEESPDGTLTRFRVDQERVDWLEDHQRAILTEDARGRGMTLLEYVGWVCRMPDAELHVYRDRVMAGSGGPRLAAVYDAWLHARITVRETQMLFPGLRPGEPDSWA